MSTLDRLARTTLAAGCLAVLAAAPPPSTVRIGLGQVGSMRAVALAAHTAHLGADWRARHPANAATTGAPLALLAGTVLSPTVTVGKPHSFVALRFQFTADSSGFNSATFTFTAPVGGRTETVGYTQGVYSVGASQSFAFLSTFPAYTAAGTWTLTGATLYDNAGSSVTYTQAQLASLFTQSSFTLIDPGKVAAYPPTVSNGALSSTTISLSAPFPQLQATVQVSDTPTGVNQALLFLQPPGQTYRQAQLSTIPFPVISGTVPLFATFYPGDATGNWTIAEYLVCDFAGNCTSSTDPATIISLFGTNVITVTN